jgi:hypothetical protein
MSVSDAVGDEASTPLATPRSFYPSHLDLWSVAECGRLLISMSELGWVPVEHSYNGRVGPSAERQDVEFAGEEPLYQRMLAGFGKVNAELYGFDLTGFAQSDPPHAIRTQPGHDHHGPHLDCNQQHPLRKLSMVVLLNAPGEFEGGELEIAGRGGQELVTGRALFFPSYFAYQVHPVVAGHRVVLVAWCHGPTFR